MITELPYPNKYLLNNIKLPYVPIMNKTIIHRYSIKQSGGLYKTPIFVNNTPTNAIIDTGATNCVISNAFWQQLNLTKTGYSNNFTPNVGFSQSNVSQIDLKFNDNCKIFNVSVIELPMISADYQFIIGNNLLDLLDYHFNKQTTSLIIDIEQ